MLNNMLEFLLVGLEVLRQQATTHDMVRRPWKVQLILHLFLTYAFVQRSTSRSASKEALIVRDRARLSGFDV